MASPQAPGERHGPKHDTHSSHRTERHRDRSERQIERWRHRQAGDIEIDIDREAGGNCSQGRARGRGCRFFGGEIVFSMQHDKANKQIPHNISLSVFIDVGTHSA